MADEARQERENYVSLLEKTLADWKEHHSLHHSGCVFPPAVHCQTSRSSTIGDDTSRVLVPTGPLDLLVTYEDSNGRTRGNEQLEFIEESGYPPTKPPRKRRKGKQAAVKVDDVKWRRTATKLVDSIPHHEEWKGILVQHGVYQDLREGKLVAHLLDGTALAHRRSGSLHEKHGLVLSADTPIDRVMSYAKAAATTEESAQAAISFAYFQQFLVLSACAVLLHCGKASTEEVYTISKVCIKKEVSEDYCRQILQTACFMNELLDCLSSHCFGHHASELLLIWKRPVQAFFDLGHSEHSRNASLRHFRAAFTEPEFTFKVDEGEQQWTPIFVPVVIHHILDKAISIPRISHVLGYRNSDVLGERVNPWQFFQTGGQSRTYSTLKAPRDIPCSQPALDRACEQSTTLNCPQHSCCESLDEVGIVKLALASRPYQVYAAHPQVPFAFEMIESEGWNEKVLVFAQSWLKHDVHIQQVEKAVGRKCNALSDRDNLLRAWCLFKLKQVEGAGWKQVSGGLATYDEPQAIVLIALEDLGPENGFFTKLRKGEWVCKDGEQAVALPSTGGGKGIFLALHM